MQEENYGAVQNAILQAFATQEAKKIEHDQSIMFDSDAHFVIDATNREIINNSGKKNIVQYDHNSEIITFEMKRYIEGHDMSECDDVTILFDDAGKKGKYRVTNLKKSGEDNVSFGWLISKNVTQNVGKIKFSVSFVCSNESEILYKWSTSTNETLEVIPSMDDGGNQAAEVDINKIVEDVTNAVLAKLPSDYSTILEKVEQKQNDLGLYIDNDGYVCQKEET